MPRGFDPFRARPSVAVQANTGLRNEMVMMKMVKKVDIGLKNETTIKEGGNEDDDDVPDDNDDDDNFR